MTLLGLVRSLHRGCARSSPLVPGPTFAASQRHANAPGARKRTRAFVVRRMIGLAEEGCQTGRASSEGRPGGPLGRSKRILPGSIAESPCGARSGGAILTKPSAPGRSRVTPSEPSSGSPGSDVPRCRNGIRDLRDPGFPVVGPRLRDPNPSRPSRIDDSTIWMPSRSGAPPSASSRCRSHRPTSRPGFVTRSWSTSTTSASGSPSPTASPRTGWRPAIGR